MHSKNPKPNYWNSFDSDFQKSLFVSLNKPISIYIWLYIENTMKNILPFLLTLLMLAIGFAAAAQESANAVIKIEGEVTQVLELTKSDLSALGESELEAPDKEGKNHRYKGVLLHKVLEKAGVTLGKDLRGRNLVKFVLLHAADDYEVIYTLPEIDPEFTDNPILLAYEMDGSELEEGIGPFRIVNPADKKPARWIRELTVIKIISL